MAIFDQVAKVADRHIMLAAFNKIAIGAPDMLADSANNTTPASFADRHAEYYAANKWLVNDLKGVRSKVSWLPCIALYCLVLHLGCAV